MSVQSSHPLYFVLTFVVVASAACGRVGVQLLSFDAGVDATWLGDSAAVDDSGIEDAQDGCNLDGSFDCYNACGDANYRPDDRCGVGYCRSHNTPSSCANGIERACVPGAPLSSDDTTCDGVDDNCDGVEDEGYAPTSIQCGVGACARMGQNICSLGARTDACIPGAPTASIDDVGWPGNGVDDDCDGRVDEDVVNPCNTAPSFYGAGAHANIAVPPGCKRVVVRLWGGAGGTGRKTQSQPSAVAGSGGAGGYASSAIVLPGRLDLYVGGGASGCGDGSGGIAAISGYRGGAGGSGDASGPRDGEPGGDGLVAGGGAGGLGSISTGGQGHYGGGGGGSGWKLLAPPNGGGGGGGAATVLFLEGSPIVVAGGGGGSGGINGSDVGSTTGRGGAGCGGLGGGGSAGGGGGGTCRGDDTRRGVDDLPFQSESIPPGLARGGPQGTECAPGGDGYAVITFAP